MQIPQSVYHLAKCGKIFFGIILEYLLIIRPCRQIFVAHKAVIGQMSGSSVTEIHDRVLACLVQAVDINAVLKIIGSARVMDELDLSLNKPVAVGHNLIKVVVGVIDSKRRRACKVAVSPCICEYVHRDADSLQRLAFRELYGIDEQIAVRLTDQAVFIQILFPASLPCRVEIVREKMKRRPDTGDILQADAVDPRVHHLKLQLSRRGGKRSLQL